MMSAVSVTKYEGIKINFFLEGWEANREILHQRKYHAIQVHKFTDINLPDHDE